MEANNNISRRLMANKGFCTKTPDGYKGLISIDGVVMEINTTFWDDGKGKKFIWIRCNNETVYDSEKNKYYQTKPSPFFECYALDLKQKFPNVSYKGIFLFVGFQYVLYARYETREEKTLLFNIERTENQPIIEAMNNQNKEKN
jgi:hypothetical protein